MLILAQTGDITDLRYGPYLGRLPQELRNRIYELSVVTDQEVPLDSKEPNLSKICRIMRPQVLEVFHKKTPLFVVTILDGNTEALINLLHLKGEEGLKDMNLNIEIDTECKDAEPLIGHDYRSYMGSSGSLAQNWVDLVDAMLIAGLTRSVEVHFASLFCDDFVLLDMEPESFNYVIELEVFKQSRFEEKFMDLLAKGEHMDTEDNYRMDDDGCRLWHGCGKNAT